MKTQSPITALIWCITVLIVIWIAHRSSLEITITHRIDLSPILKAAPSAVNPAASSRQGSNP